MGDSSTSRPVYSQYNFVFLEEVEEKENFFFILIKKLKIQMLLKRFIIILFFSGITNSLFAQILMERTYRWGEMITQKDTIQCYLEERENKYSNKVRYKLKSDDKRPLKIKSANMVQIKFNDEEIYDRINNVQNEFVLLKRLTSGPVRLYKENLNNDSSTTVALGGTMIYARPTPDFYYLVKHDQIYIMSKLTFRESLKKIFTNNPEFEKLIHEIKYREFINNIEEIVNDYNKMASN